MAAPQGLGEADIRSVIEKQRRNLQAAQSRKGQRPAITQSREMTIMQFMFQHKISTINPIQNTVRTSFLPPAYPPSVASLDTLQRCMFKDLRLETHHRGSYIVLRAVTPPQLMVGVMLIVEDEEENVVQLSLYNQDVHLTADGGLAQGTVMVVKEPYLKVVAAGNYAIRVDHLSDIIFVPEHDPIVPLSWKPRICDAEASAYDWKVAGNDKFSQGMYHQAINCYSQALNRSPSTAEIVIIRQNRALCFLKTHQFDAALRDLDGLPEPQPSEKTLYRKAQALYHLQRFQESCEAHRALASAYPNNDTAKAEFKRARERLEEQKHGRYQFKQMHAEARKRSPPILDRATHIGPVAVKQTESRGRGLFTTRPVQAGDLLLCEKAFAYVFSDIANPDQHRSILINIETSEMTKGADVDLIPLAVQKLQQNPSMAPAVTALYHGPYSPVAVSEVDGMPVVDTFLIERVLSKNSFACPRSSREHYIHALRHSPNVEHDLKSPSGGLWPMASYINHACSSNSRSSFIGDMMVIRATEDMPANTEITIWYRAADYDSMPNNMRHWGFDCTCVLCQDYRETEKGAMSARKLQIAEMHKALSRQVPHFAKAESILSATEKTYRQPASEVPRLELWEMCLALASNYAAHSNSRKSVKFALKTLESLSYVVTGAQLPHVPGTQLRVEKWGMLQGRVIRCWMMLARAYLKIAPQLVSQAVAYARLSYKMWLGEDETFDQTIDLWSDRLDGLLDSAR